MWEIVYDHLYVYIGAYMFLALSLACLWPLHWVVFQPSSGWLPGNLNS